MAGKRKIAVVLFNLGGPDSTDSIRPFLRNFFMDKNIIAAPLPVRFLLSRYIAATRGRKEAAAAYGALGGRSPLLQNTRAQAHAVQDALSRIAPDNDWKCFVSMRYWHPMSDETARLVADFGPDEIVLAPLYPQFSTTTTRSSLQDWRRAAGRIGLRKPESVLCCYPVDRGFVAASAQLVRSAYDAARRAGHVPRILFSAHGLPEKIIDAGDPYQWQCEQTAAAIVAQAGLGGADWMSCYQSRVGPLKWIGPSTDDALVQAARDGVGVIVYPHAFVSEHVETLVEIEIEYREKAQHLGLPYFARVPTVMCEKPFIDGLAAQIAARAGTFDTTGADGVVICPAGRGDCCARVAAKTGKEAA